MKVVGINSSPREKGNTSMLMKVVLEELEKFGIETEIITFGQNVIEPCKACFACAGKGNCIHQNDQFTVAFQKIAEADGILLGSPVYSADVSANMKAFIERAAVVADVNPNLLKHKVGASVAAARRGGALHAIDCMNHFFLNHEMFVVGSVYWNMVYGKFPGDVLSDEEGIENMINLGQNMAYLLNKIKEKNNELEQK